MDTLSAKVSYIKGLAEGLNISSETAEGKVLLKIIEALDDIADSLDDLMDAYDELEEKVDEIDSDLADVEEFVYDEDYDEDDDEENLDDFFDEDDDEFFELECPNCGEDVLIDFDMLEDDKGIICPNCHEAITLEFDDENENSEE